MAQTFASAGLNTPPNYQALYTSRMFTGLYTNRSLFRDGASSFYEERAGYGRQDSILAGDNSEVSPRLTLVRRPGHSVYNSQSFAPIRRFYSFNTFNLTDEVIRVMADTDTDVYDATGPNTKKSIFKKSAAAQDGKHPTYFLGVGNLLFMTNGIDNRVWDYNHDVVNNWGIVGPPNAPSLSLPPLSFRGSWAPNTVFERNNYYCRVCIIDSGGYIQNLTTAGTTGAAEPTNWDTRFLYSTTDGSCVWQNYGHGGWVAGAPKSGNDLDYEIASDGNFYFYQAQNGGHSGATVPKYLPGIGSVTQDGDVRWLNLGPIMHWSDLGANTPIAPVNTIVDANSNIHTVIKPGKSGTTEPKWTEIKDAVDSDPPGGATGSVFWKNMGEIGPVQYGYAFMNSKTGDISNMSPASVVIATADGQEIDVTGDRSPDPQADTVILYRTTHYGSTFFYDAQFPNPAAGNTWSYADTTLDKDLNVTWEAQRAGEGNPLPSGATCLEYHLGRIFAAVGNVVYTSAGPDAIITGSSGLSGFPITFTAQSKITRFWANSLGLVVFTVRDTYIILGDGVDTSIGGQGLYMVKWLENIPLLSYDAFSVFNTTAYMLTGKKMTLALDPGAGIQVLSHPIADVMEAIDPSKAYVTYHAKTSRETALYVADATSYWYRMNPIVAPDQGFNWAPKATIAAGRSAVQSVEVTPGQYELLVGPASSGPILKRDTSTHTDNGAAYTAHTVMGIITLGSPGQLAGLAWMTLEATNDGTPPALSMLLGEVTGTFENVPRTRQDPTNLPPSQSFVANRHSLLQNQTPAWCRHMQFAIDWPAEDAPNELLSFTIFGELWQEVRPQ